MAWLPCLFDWCIVYLESPPHLKNHSQCNRMQQFKKSDGCCCTVHFSGGCCILNWTVLYSCYNPCYILLHMTLLTGYECCLSCCMLCKHHHSQCNKIPVEWYIHVASMPNATKSPVAHCCTRHATDDHLVKLTFTFNSTYNKIHMWILLLLASYTQW